MAGKWYNPTTEAWQTNQPADYIKIKKNEKNVYEYDVPIKEAMTGILELHFVTDTKTISTSTYSPTLQKVYYLSSISVEYESEQSKTYNSQIDDVQATATNGAKFRDDVTYNSNICIRGTLEANSKNFLIDPDGEVSPGLYDTPYENASLFSPLQRLCDETVSEMNTIGRLYELPVRWRGGITHDITPNTMIYISPLNEWAYAVGWEMNLRDDVIKLKLLRRKYSEGNQ
jgi:hypothetical protein